MKITIELTVIETEQLRGIFVAEALIQMAEALPIGLPHEFFNDKGQKRFELEHASAEMTIE